MALFRSYRKISVLETMIWWKEDTITPSLIRFYIKREEKRWDRQEQIKANKISEHTIRIAITLASILGSTLKIPCVSLSFQTGECQHWTVKLKF